MSSKSNMERAEREECWFWVAESLTLVLLSLIMLKVLPLESERDNSTIFLVFVFVCVALTGAIAHRTFLALKQEIADLKSGDADVSAAHQDSE